MDFGRLIRVSKDHSLYEKDGVCYKVFDNEHRKTRAFYEAGVHALIEETDINIPLVFGVFEDDDKYIIKCEFKDATTLAELMENDPENTDDYIRDMVELQVQVHEQKVGGLALLRYRFSNEIKRLECISEEKRQELLSILSKMPNHDKLCHGDYKPENIWITEDGEIFLSEWVLAASGNASADVANTYLTLALDSTETAEKYLDIYCEKAHTKKEYARAWIPIVAASQLARGESDERKKLLLFSWLDIV